MFMIPTMPGTRGLSAETPSAARISAAQREAKPQRTRTNFSVIYRYGPGATTVGSPGRQGLSRQRSSKAGCLLPVPTETGFLEGWVRLPAPQRGVMGEAPPSFLLLCPCTKELLRCFADEERDMSEGEACSSGRRWVSALASPPRLHLGMFQANTVTQMAKHLPYFPFGPLSASPEEPMETLNLNSFGNTHKTPELSGSHLQQKHRLGPYWDLLPSCPNANAKGVSNSQRLPLQ